MEIINLIVNSIIAGLLGYVVGFCLATVVLMLFKPKASGDKMEAAFLKIKIRESTGKIGLYLGALIVIIHHLITNVNI